LYEMDYLQEGIGLRAMGQRDPLVEYQREGYDLFMAMMDSVKEEVVGFVFHAQLQQPTEPQTLEADTNGQPAPSNENVSRNDPCPCGSGKKYKRCHGDPRNAGKSSTNYQTAASPL